MIVSTVIVSCTCAWPVVAAETYRKRTGDEIKAQVIGMEISDAHFSEQYMANGTVRVVDLDRRFLGKWKVEGSQLCTEAPRPEDSRCKEVWGSGKKYQLRFPGDPVPFDVDIQNQQPRGW